MIHYFGIYDGHAKFVRKYANIVLDMQTPPEAYLSDVRGGQFPDEEKESFHMASDEQLKRLHATREEGGVVPFLGGATGS